MMMAKATGTRGFPLTTASATGYGVAIPTAYRSQPIILPPVIYTTIAIIIAPSSNLVSGNA